MAGESSEVKTECQDDAENLEKTSDECPMKLSLLPQGSGKPVAENRNGTNDNGKALCKYAHGELMKARMHNGSTVSIGISDDDLGDQCVVSFQSIGYDIQESVPVPGKRCCSRTERVRHILQNVRFVTVTLLL
jgi:hypothetical protein